MHKWIVSLAILYILTSCNSQNQEGENKHEITRDFYAFENAINLFYRTYDRYPANLEELFEENKTQGYLKKKEYRIDPYGAPYILNIFEGHVEVLTYGKDGKSGGEGDDKDHKLQVKMD